MASEYHRKKWSNIIVLAILSAISSGLSLMYAWLFRSLIDSAAAKAFDQTLHSALLLVFFMILGISLGAMRQYIWEDGRSGIENSVKGRLFYSLLTKEYAGVSAVHSGDWMTRMTNDSRVVADGMIQMNQRKRMKRSVSSIRRTSAAFVWKTCLSPILSVL